MNEQSWLTWFLKGILFLGLLILSSRLFELQILKGEYFQALAAENRVRRVPLLAPRGEILARGGEVLAKNREIKKWVTFDSQTGYVKKEVTVETPPDEIVSEWRREYVLKDVLAHTTGYLSEVSESEVGKIDVHCPQKGVRILGSLTGRSGLEEEYNCTLRGVDGEELVEVDAYGKKVRTLGRKNPLTGDVLKTNIDYLLQMKLTEVMNSQKDLAVNWQGAAVITDTKGEILAFYSKPSFDPNKITPSLLTDENLPLFNRVIGGTYHPGSVFKIVTAAAALEEKKIDADYTYNDPGVIKVNEFSYANWYFSQYGATEGIINLQKAIARSTDTFFYKVGEFLGPETLAKWAEKFGLDEKTKVDLPGEVVGLVPTPVWKERVKGERWFLGNTYHMAIGQGDLAVTPLAINRMTGVIASGGFLCQPHFVGSNAACQNLGLREETIAEIKSGMEAACSQGGTGYPFFDFEEKSAGVKVACKTGTAETQEEDKTHAWFTVFGSSSPEDTIIMTVLVEKGGEGSAVAAPIAREVFDYYFGVTGMNNLEKNEGENN
jgi:penicillin-binding protein 2